MPLVIAVLLGLSALMIVLYPLFGFEREAVAPEAERPLSEVAERERAAREALREVEFDYRLGNLDAADYRTLRDRYERRALSALKTRYQREQELDALIERQLDALRAEQSRVVMDAAGATTPAAEAAAAVAPTKDQAGRKPGRGPQARRRRRV